MNLREIENGVINTCLEVGEFIRKEGASFDRARIEQKDGFNNLVSYVDKEAERRIVEQLRKLAPQAGYITEEGTVEQSNQHEYNWVIDPLDGTTNFLHGLPIYSISIALTHRDETVVGVVHHIVRNECFHAVKESPAYCNGKEIRVSPVPTMQESLLATGFPYYHSSNQNAYLEIIKEFLEKSHGIRRLGSAAIDLAYVACGRLEGFFEYNLNPWDVAAGAFIVQRAGGKVTDFKGGSDFMFGRELCASNSHVHTPMLTTIQQKWVS